mmetsp:Transcript_7056/g.31870  ORF Transcript_7056/g.31870 Transcript_7056/m.31870 type:complete len:236 (-) Transcript_7056:1172-1879(-)
MTPFMSICSPLPCFSLVLDKSRPTTPTSPSRSTASPVPSSSKNTLLRLTLAGMSSGISPGRLAPAEDPWPGILSRVHVACLVEPFRDWSPTFLGVGVLGLGFAAGPSASSSSSSSSSSSISIASSSSFSSASLSSSFASFVAPAGGDLTILAGVDFISNFSSVLFGFRWKMSRIMPSSLSSSSALAVGDLNDFIQSGSSSLEPSRFAGIVARGRAKSGRSSSLSSSMTIGIWVGD